MAFDWWDFFSQDERKVREVEKRESGFLIYKSCFGLDEIQCAYVFDRYSKDRAKTRKGERRKIANTTCKLRKHSSSRTPVMNPGM